MDVATETASRLIDRRVGGGRVARRVDLADRRLNAVFATDAGMACVKAVARIGSQVGAVTGKGIAEEVLAIPLRVVGRIPETLKAELAHP